MDVPKISGTWSDFSFLSPPFLSLASIRSRREKRGIHVLYASSKVAMELEDQTKLLCGPTYPNPHGHLPSKIKAAVLPGPPQSDSKMPVGPLHVFLPLAARVQHTEEWRAQAPMCAFRSDRITSTRDVRKLVETGPQRGSGGLLYLVTSPPSPGYTPFKP